MPRTSDWTVNKTCVLQTMNVYIKTLYRRPYPNLRVPIGRLLAVTSNIGGGRGRAMPDSAARYADCPLMTTDTFESEWACGKEEE